MLDNVLLVELGQMLDQGFPRPDVTSWYSSEFHARVLRILDVIYTQRVKEGADGGGALPERDALTVVRFCKAYAAVLEALQSVSIPVNRTRTNVKTHDAQVVTGMCLGVVHSRSNGITTSNFGRDRPNLTRLLVEFGEKIHNPL